MRDVPIVMMSWCRSYRFWRLARSTLGRATAQRARRWVPIGARSAPGAENLPGAPSPGFGSRTLAVAAAGLALLAAESLYDGENVFII